jgi:hypothetical protein
MTLRPENSPPQHLHVEDEMPGDDFDDFDDDFDEDFEDDPDGDGIEKEHEVEFGWGQGGD